MMEKTASINSFRTFVKLSIAFYLIVIIGYMGASWRKNHEELHPKNLHFIGRAITILLSTGVYNPAKRVAGPVE